MTFPTQYDETIQVGTDYWDREEVLNYDRNMQKLRNLNAEADEMGRALGFSSDSTIWEIGTGTGECALALAPKSKHVYATDISPAMLECARHKARQRQIDNVTFKAGGFLSGFQPGEKVDGIVSQLALHHLPDFWKARAIDVLAGKLKPKGRLYLRDVVFPSGTINYDEYFQAIVDEVRAKAGDEVAQQTIQHIRTEFSTLDWILEGIIARSGLNIIEKSRQGFLSAYVCEK